MRKSKTENTFYDVYLLNTEPKNERLLQKVAASTKKVCCWVKLQRFMNGFVRVIAYTRTENRSTGALEKNTMYMYEGEYLGGEANNFGRYTASFGEKRFIGFFNKGFKTLKKGYGVYIKKAEYVSSGMFAEGANYSFDQPKYSTFSKFELG